MVRKQVYLEAEQDAALKRWAAEEGCSEAELLRRALDSFLTRKPASRRNPLWDMVGIVKDQITDGSVKHDDAPTESHRRSFRDFSGIVPPVSGATSAAESDAAEAQAVEDVVRAARMPPPLTP